ncbi:ABC transporter permease [Cryobacterium sp. Y50]|uniref:ABC transporter permease n=1 Tax=Cryobacterium sp. Y50 TaxID=2048286 RepID=UPI000CE403DA|nr:ABC transporter permease [Cryobacterium sp. Y50]
MNALNRVLSELRKIATYPMVWIVFALIIALQVYLLAQAYPNLSGMLRGVSFDTNIELFRGEVRSAGSAVLDLAAAASFQTAAFLPIVIALAIGQEYREARQLSISLLAVPRRRQFVLAKYASTAVLAIAFSIVVNLVTTIGILAAAGSWSSGLLSSPAAWLASGRFTFVCLVLALLTAGLTLVTRDVLSSIGIMIVLAVVSIGGFIGYASPAFQALLPFDAARSLLLDSSFAGSSTPLLAVLILSAWVLVFGVLGWLCVARRDA